MGVIEMASYKVDGNSVIVTTESGPMKGLAVRYSVIDQNTLRADYGLLKRLR